MADFVAPVSNKAYTDMETPPELIKMGTIGLKAPIPTYAEASHASKFESMIFSSSGLLRCNKVL